MNIFIILKSLEIQYYMKSFQNKCYSMNTRIREDFLNRFSIDMREEYK